MGVVVPVLCVCVYYYCYYYLWSYWPQKLSKAMVIAVPVYKAKTACIPKTFSLLFYFDIITHHQCICWMCWNFNGWSVIGICCETVNIKVGQQTQWYIHTQCEKIISTVYTATNPFLCWLPSIVKFPCDWLGEKRGNFSKKCRKCHLLGCLSTMEFDSYVRSFLPSSYQFWERSESCSRNMSAAFHIHRGMLASLHNVVSQYTR